LPERPLFSVPRLRSCIARSTFFPAFFPYFLLAIPRPFFARTRNELLRLIGRDGRAEQEALELVARLRTQEVRGFLCLHALAHHLTRYGDTLAVTVVDPLAAVDAVIRFDCGHHPDRLTGWTTGRTPTDIARVLARAELIARDYFGIGFPPIPW